MFDQRRQRCTAKVRRRDGSNHVIPIDDIVSVEFVPSTTVWNGYVRFTLADDDESDEDDRAVPPSAGAAVKLASRNPNAVMFSRYQSAAFTELYDAVAAAIEHRDA